MSNGTTMGYDDFFSIDEGGGNGIYMYNFDKPGQQIRVYSRSSSVKIEFTQDHLQSKFQSL